MRGMAGPGHALVEELDAVLHLLQGEARGQKRGRVGV